MTTAANFDHASVIQEAMQLLAQSQFADAVSAFEKILSVAPDSADACNGLALALWQSGDTESALSASRRAILLAPTSLSCQLTFAQLASSLGRHAEALPAYQTVCVARHDLVDVWLGLARSLHALGRLNEAVAVYEEAHAIAPENVDVLNDLGVAQDEAGQYERAIDRFCQGLTLRPDYLPLHNNLGNALLHAGRLDEAVSAFRRGLGIAPDSAELWFNLANAYALRSLPSEAIEIYRRALTLDPRHVKALLNLGNALRTQGKLALAVDCFRQAIAIDSLSYDGYNNLGVTLLAMGNIDDSIESLNRATTLRPESSTAYNNLGNALKDAGRLDDALAAFQRAMELNPKDSQPHSNLVYALSFHPSYDDLAIFREARRWNARHAANVPRQAHEHDKHPDRRLRIGYISPDFRDHCQSLFTIPLLENHDHAHYEIYCYAHLAAPDAISRRIESYADVWRAIYGLSDEAVAMMIREDKIDILVDLTMHMSNGRPLVFARKPAPVQIAWLAYPGTTGQTAIDYRLTDPWLDAPNSGDEHYSETSLWLENSFWCYDPLTTALTVNELPAISNGYVTFGCLNNFCKVSDPTLALWARVLNQMPGSRLILLAAPGHHRHRVLLTLLEYGVAGERIEFVEFRPRERYLQTYHRIDLCLDTLPYNGHTTSLDAYWMGVPVISKIGRTVVGRAGWSQLNNLGLSEFAAWNGEQFVQIAVRLGQDIERLSVLRHTLRKTMQSSPLMDANRFARTIEANYRRCWHKWCIQESA